MANIVGVRFQRAGPLSYYDSGELELQVTEAVVVETHAGERVGWVVIAPDQVIFSEVVEPLGLVLRKATPQELEDSKALSSGKSASAEATGANPAF